MRHLAIDIGAESGRAFLGWLEDGKLRAEEIHRFPNTPIIDGPRLHWDIEGLFESVLDGIAMAGLELDSVGIDTWGVDFALIDATGDLVETPFHYRDLRTKGVIEQSSKTLPPREIYAQTGVQLMQFNSLFQLFAADKDSLESAATFLTIPDYLNYRLTGERACEFTNATTTQCYDPTANSWALNLLETFGIPRSIFPNIVEPGSILGIVRGSKARAVSVASHDTGSAVAGIPFAPNAKRQTPNALDAWISSGTWSVMGVEIPEPIITDAGFKANFSNEGGINHTFRLCKNVMGLWIIQQCRAEWQTFTYQELTEMATRAQPDFATIDPDDYAFFSPGDMPRKINEYLKATNQKTTDDIGQIVRIVIEGLATKYSQLLKSLEEITGKTIERLHIVGGGSQNRLLNQITADKCGIPVLAGPTEAAAIGNLAVQMIAMGQIGSIEEARSIIGNSFPIETFEPCKT